MPVNPRIETEKMNRASSSRTPWALHPRPFQSGTTHGDSRNGSETRARLLTNRAPLRPRSKFLVLATLQFQTFKPGPRFPPTATDCHPSFVSGLRQKSKKETVEILRLRRRLLRQRPLSTTSRIRSLLMRQPRLWSCRSRLSPRASRIQPRVAAQNQETMPDVHTRRESPKTPQAEAPSG